MQPNQTDTKTVEKTEGGGTVASSALLGVGRTYKNLGNLSAVEGWASVGLCCDVCMVEWIGCFDQADCPQCGNHDDWDRLMEARGHYNRETPNDQAHPTAAGGTGGSQKGQTK